ncbi:MAG: TatD family hydrolase, partial [Deltaproteobacteria bacterium]|nr:TatD family hydrolase [Deltaproteobacteria bacterium]
MGKKKKKPPLPVLPAGTSVIDTHCHLDMIHSGEDTGTVVSRAVDKGVSRIITVGIDLDSSQKAIAIAENFATVYATVGVHPHNVQGLENSTYSKLETLCDNSRVVAYGEIGLDYVKLYAPKKVQLEHYARQVALAKKTGLPLVIHDREAHKDILDVLEKETPIEAAGVMHCFSGDWQFAKKVLDLGFFIS